MFFVAYELYHTRLSVQQKNFSVNARQSGKSGSILLHCGRTDTEEEVPVPARSFFLPSFLKEKCRRLI